ncbi:MAG: recombinase RecT [Acidiferrobacterales bacterium]
MADKSREPTVLPAWKQAIQRAKNKFDGHQSGLSYQAEALFAYQACTNSKFLMETADKNPESMTLALVNVAAMGLTLNPSQKLAYLIPRKGKIILDISYRGLLQLATMSGSIVSAKPIIVRANDEFAFNGPFQYPVHQFDPFASRESRGEIIGVYCVARLHDGSVQVDTMNMERVHEIRARSEAFNRKNGDPPSGPWVTDEEEMILKTIIKVASKTWPMIDTRLSEAIHMLDSNGEGIDTAVTSECHRVPEEQGDPDKASPEARNQVKKLVERARASGSWAAAEDWAMNRFHGHDFAYAKAELDRAKTETNTTTQRAAS